MNFIQTGEIHAVGFHEYKTIIFIFMSCLHGENKPFKNLLSASHHRYLMETLIRMI